MLDLIHTTEEQHYENYRLEQMETRKPGEARVKKPDNPKFKEEEEALRKRFTEQVKAEEARFRQWEQHVCPQSSQIQIRPDPPLAYCRARPPQQGFGNYPQLDKSARSRARQYADGVPWFPEDQVNDHTPLDLHSGLRFWQNSPLCFYASLPCSHSDAASLLCARVVSIVA